MLQFKHPVAITSVDIFETNGAGTVVRVAAKEEDTIESDSEGDVDNEDEAKVERRKLKAQNIEPGSWQRVVADGKLGAGASATLQRLDEEWVVLWEREKRKDTLDYMRAVKFSPPLLNPGEVVSRVVRIDLDCRTPGTWVEIDCVKVKGWRVRGGKE